MPPGKNRETETVNPFTFPTCKGVGIVYPDKAPVFTCQKCGNHELLVVHERGMMVDTVGTLKCTCGSQKEFAYRDQAWEAVTERKKFWLTEEQKIEWMSTERIVREQNVEPTAKPEVGCQKCYERFSATSASGVWKTEAIEEMEDTGDDCPDDSMLFYCARCGEEVDVHIGRDGWIWQIANSSEHQ